VANGPNIFQMLLVVIATSLVNKDEVITPLPRKRSRTKRGNIINANRTTSYVLNFGDAGLNLTKKFLHNVQK